MLAAPHLNRSSSKAAQLLNVLALLANDGSHCLCWDVHMDRLLLRSLYTKYRIRQGNK